jgi:hypothetical protein
LSSAHDDIRDLLSSPSSFSSSVSPEEHLRMGKLGDENGLADIAFAHYSAVLEDENANDIATSSAELMIAELSKRFPLIGKKIKIENVKLIPEASLFEKIKEYVILRIIWVIILPILTIIGSYFL